MEVFSEEDTKQYASRMANDAKAGDIICLDGDLGVGKTVFAKAFAEGLGVNEAVVSPTFTIMHAYESGRLPVYHFDAYRIVEPEEMYELGFDEYLFGDGVCLIEWAENIADMIPKEAKHISIRKSIEKGENYRIIEVAED